MEKVYYVSVYHYNYFAGGSKTETKRFSRILDAYKFQRESAASDYDYDDAYQYTSRLCSYWNTTVAKTGKHPYKARPKAKRNTLVVDHIFSPVSEWGDIPFI